MPVGLEPESLSGPKGRLVPEKATLSLITFSGIFNCVDREPKCHIY